MGNSITNEFINLDDEKKEKSIFSFKVKLVEKSIDIDNEGNKKEEKFSIKMKIKLYPSCLTIKNENFEKDFSYYDIKCWYNQKNFFSFRTEKESYFFFTRDDLRADDISKALNGICNDLKKKQNNFIKKN